MVDKYKTDNFLDMRFYYENFSLYNSVILFKHYTNLMKLFNWNVKNGLDPNKMTIYKTDCQLTLALSSKMYNTIKFKLKDEYTKTDYTFDKVKVMKIVNLTFLYMLRKIISIPAMLAMKAFISMMTR